MQKFHARLCSLWWLPLADCWFSFTPDSVAEAADCAVVSTGLQLLFGAIALLWGTWALESRRHAVWTKSAVFYLTFLVVFGSCAAFVIYYWLLKRMQPYQLSSISLIVPVIALLEGALVAHEAVRPMTLLAIMVVLCSVATVLRSPPEPSHKDGRILNLKEDIREDLRGPS